MANFEPSAKPFIMCTYEGLWKNYMEGTAVETQC